VLLDTRRATLTITAYQPEMVESVRAFNRRLRSAGVSYQFPEDSTPAWLPRRPGARAFQEYYVAADDAGTIRGGYILKWQDFRISRQTVPVGYVHLPLSEGLIDRKYSALGAQLIIHACKQAPRLFALGIGSMDEPLAKMLKALGWPVQAVPFHFRALHPFTVARQLSYLRTTAARRMVLDLAAYSGAAWTGLRFAQGGMPGAGIADVEQVDRFDSWADGVWDRARDCYRFVGCRDADTLNQLFPSDGRYVRLKISARGTTLGWAVLLDTQMTANKYFGNLRVGSIVDCLSMPEHADMVIAAALRWLADCGVDLVVTNQASRTWCDALQRNGFLSGPSTFIFAVSRTLDQDLQPLAAGLGHVHVNRGDGDGPINL
jgi:hypothetical protein